MTQVESPVDVIQTVLTLERRLGALRGMAWGLWQPALPVLVSVAADLAGSFEALDRAMLALVVTPLDVAADAGLAAAGPRALLARVHHWQAAVQREADVPVFGPCHVAELASGGSPGRSRMLLALPCADQRATAGALDWVIGAVNTLLAPGGSAASVQGSLQASLSRLRTALKPAAVRGVNSIHFLAAAHRLGMQVGELAPGIHAIGVGRRSRRLNSSVTDETRLIAAGIAQDKANTAKVLALHGLPAPAHRLVVSEEDAVAVAASLGYPVVVKPADLDGGRGVFAGLQSEAVVRSAWREASRMSRRILVERHVEGDDFRFTVAGGEVVKIMQRRAGGVTGDGQADVAALLARVQATEPHQRALRREGKLRLSLDRDALELLDEQGLDAASVPAPGRFVRLRRKANISAGGEHWVVAPAAVHPDNIELALCAARAIGLDIAGVDLIIDDVRRPWHETFAVICEVNAKPQIGLRDTPEVYAGILQRLLPEGGTIPLHLMVLAESSDGASDALRTLSGRLGCNAVSCAQGVWVDERRSVWRPADAFAAAQAMLLDARVEAAVVAMTMDEIVRCGLPARRFVSATLAREAVDRLPAPRRAILAAMLRGQCDTIRVSGPPRAGTERAGGSDREAGVAPVTG
ncbi:cyanophycin synthetase [Quisquiliibacterium transsilvanicum]|uniref:Cyanophycin synthetase n=1 Tax=Quisquiliibacterium transsilvanicum TaxID=1549638 RepID=A0A7W8HJ82_9BURK|nr:cyanophycin synthetase [Quisquiliibacterium transsilvanicum]MBB5272198.1 cyanophycin synthetase [Quisquiliibacterium transsilvanicum]